MTAPHAPSAPFPEHYDPATLEAEVQRQWQQKDLYRVGEDKTRPKYYACSMLPYPSGKLHMGHVRNYTINDALARYKRMRGYNVLMPMGWDAFGLPAENAAIASGRPPAEWTRANIAEMKAQMQPLGLAFDWSREVASCNADYYHWNQWLFLKMLERGIAYKKTQIVNWDPVDQTVLANEQVIDGRGWRSGAVVEKREIPGYYLGITQYAEELLNAIDTLDGWPEQVRTMQRNWIGKSEGVRFAFPHTLCGADGKLLGEGKLWVFTTRADTIMGVTFCAVAAEHPLAQHAAQDNTALAAFIEKCRQGGASEAELAARNKEGVDTGLTVSHPLTGEPVPLWVGNYVLMGYGDGAVMGVPAHDERDFAFARQYGLPIRQVVAAPSRGGAGEGSKDFTTDRWQDGYGDKSTSVCINSGRYDGLAYPAAVDAIAADLAAQGLGEKKTTWRLRDWGISRQRYWGTPIPIIHCPACGAVPVPEKDLPVVLPTDCVPDGSGNPLDKHATFLKVDCPRCGMAARRETDTMDTFVDSSWYFMRYCDPKLDHAMVEAGTRYWMPMDQYIGGIEHAVLHLLYARFWTKVMRDFGLVDFDEPFTRLFTQGMLLRECYYREETDGRKRWFYPAEIEVRTDDKGRPLGAIAKADGQPVVMGGIEKMSKSKNNVVEPGEIIARYGADTARLFTLFAGPPDQSALWSDSGVEGASRFLRRLWRFLGQTLPSMTQLDCRQLSDAVHLDKAGKDFRFEVHSTLRQINADYERMQYNTVVSGCMKLFNAIENYAANPTPNLCAVSQALHILLRVLYPVCPHLCWDLWQRLHFAEPFGDLPDAGWPEPDLAALAQDDITLVLQINGKLRGELLVPASADKAAIEQAALAHEKVLQHLMGQTAQKVVIVPGRLVNVVG